MTLPRLSHVWHDPTMVFFVSDMILWYMTWPYQGCLMSDMTLQCLTWPCHGFSMSEITLWYMTWPYQGCPMTWPKCHTSTPIIATKPLILPSRCDSDHFVDKCPLYEPKNDEIQENSDFLQAFKKSKMAAKASDQSQTAWVHVDENYVILL